MVEVGLISETINGGDWAGILKDAAFVAIGFALGPAVGVGAAICCIAIDALEELDND